MIATYAERMKITGEARDASGRQVLLVRADGSVAYVDGPALLDELAAATERIAALERERDAAHAWAREASMEERELRTRIAGFQSEADRLTEEACAAAERERVSREALAVLRRYLTHDGLCDRRVAGYESDCTCGLSAALSACLPNAGTEAR
jgi:hypothetical protein